MDFSSIRLQDLVVNPENDRHGPKESEADAVSWLFENLDDKMMFLLRDITAQGQIFDAPLVKPVGQKFVVFDGNRRVTCLKVLAGTYEVPNKYSKEILALRLKSNWSEDTQIECQVENDQKTVDQIVSRRHNGTDGGKGQLGWDPRAKANHANRVGGTNQYPIAEAIEDFLDSQGFPNARDLSRSTLYRLMNAKKRQRQFGIELNNDGSLKLLRDRDEVLAALTKVADDILDKELTLKNVLNSTGVDEYIGNLIAQNLIEPEELKSGEKLNGTSESDSTGRKSAPKRSKPRDTLIPQIDFEIEWRPGQGKIHLIWQELQYLLKFSRFEISIPVVLRALIEQSTKYALREEAGIPRSDTLGKQVRRAAQSFKDRGQMDEKEFKDLERMLGDTKSPRELEILHRAVHSKTVLPAKDDLIAIWTGFEKYLLLCIRS